MHSHINNKKTALVISIIIILIAAITLAIFFIFEYLNNSKQPKKLSDADAIGRANSCINSCIELGESQSVCRQRCQPAQPLIEQAGEKRVDSPFALSAFYINSKVADIKGLNTVEDVIEYIERNTLPNLLDLGMKSVRVHPGAKFSFAFNNIDPDLDGRNFDFSRQDKYVALAQKYNLTILPVFSPHSDWETDELYLPDDYNAYQKYVRATVERYDGDGKDDMEGLKYPIKYWQLENEPDLRNDTAKRKWGRDFANTQEYTDLLRLTYKALKQADPQAKLMPNFAGLGQGQGEKSLAYMKKFIELGGLSYSDLFSYHLYPETYSNNEFIDFLEKVKSLIGKDIAIWITESAIPSYKTGTNYTYSEALQARWLLEYFAYHLSHGVEKIFWLSIIDTSPSLGTNRMGLMGLMDFKRKKQKPAYYTYKLMSKKLTGYSSVEELSSGQYKFSFRDKNPIYILWNETGTTTLDLTDEINADEVTITHIIEEEGQTNALVETMPTNQILVNESPIFVEI